MAADAAAGDATAAAVDVTSTAPRARPRSGVGRHLVGVLVVGLGLAVGPAAPAFAHGPTPDATNYRSTVTGVMEPSDEAAVDVPAVSWRVLGGDGLLQLDTTGEVEVVVIGYDDEPFLRIGPGGVFTNRNSPATYLNADRYAAITVPADVDARAPPEWRRVSEATRWQWHDHRIHWMAPTPPAGVRDQPDQRQQVLAWAVPFRVEGQRLEALGVLEYVPPPSVWPWLLGAVVVVTLPIIVVAGAGARRSLRTLVVVTTGVAAAAVAVAVGDAMATPASVGANAWAVAQTAVPALVAGVLAWTAWRPTAEDAARPEWTLVVAAAIIALVCGVARLDQLTSSQVTNALPTAAVRAVVAGSLTLVVPAAVVAAVQRPGRRDR